MTYKQIQSILLIVGTAIGGGILALPISTASCGFWGAFCALLITWIFMSFAAFNITQARLSFSGDVDLATMTTTLLGKTMNQIVQFALLILLMALISMYITVGSKWIIELTQTYLDIKLSTLSAQIGFSFLLGAIIYSGLSNLARINQLITGTKIFFLTMLIVSAMPAVQKDYLISFEPQEIPDTLSMLLTTFGFSIILPSLAGYLNHNRQSLYKVLAVGTIIILLAYISWELVVFGVIGIDGLTQIATSQDKGTGVINQLSTLVTNDSFHKYSFGIMLTAVVTSFLGVGHSLFSYLKDALPGRINHRKSMIAMAIGFLPPLLILQIYPAGIASILSFAGIFVAFILGIVPNLMILSKQYQDRMGPNSRLMLCAVILSLLFFGYIIGLEIVGRLF